MQAFDGATSQTLYPLCHTLWLLRICFIISVPLIFKMAFKQMVTVRWSGWRKESIQIIISRR